MGTKDEGHEVLRGDQDRRGGPFSMQKCVSVFLPKACPCGPLSRPTPVRCSRKTCRRLLVKLVSY